MGNAHVHHFRDGQHGLQIQCSSWPALEGWLSSLLKSSAYLKVILKPGIYYMGEWVPQNKRGRLKGDKGQPGFELGYTCYGLPRGEELV